MTAWVKGNKEKMKRMLNHKIKELIIQCSYGVLGSLLFALGFNLFIVPLGLYSGGFMGLSQLINLFLVRVMHINAIINGDITGAIYFVINIPLFYLGYRVMGKEFFLKTLLTVAVQSILLMAIPIPWMPVIEDYLTSCIIGGIISGVGVGVVLRGRTSGGGQDIVGLCCSKKFKDVSVGKVNIAMNMVIYGICLALFNVEIVIYSLIYATVSSLAVDKVHIQNINTSVMIFTKKLGISKAVMEQMGRGVTNWDGEGAYTHKTAYILFVMISKYEVNQIKRIVHSIDPDAFMIFSEGCSVDGNFEKRL